MNANARILGLTTATIPVAGLASGGSSPSKDPCTLLKPAEIQVLAPSAHLGGWGFEHHLRGAWLR